MCAECLDQHGFTLLEKKYFVPSYAHGQKNHGKSLEDINNNSGSTNNNNSGSTKSNSRSTKSKKRRKNINVKNKKSRSSRKIKKPNNFVAEDSNTANKRTTVSSHAKCIVSFELFFIPLTWPILFRPLLHSTR